MDSARFEKGYKAECISAKSLNKSANPVNGTMGSCRGTGCTVM